MFGISGFELLIILIFGFILVGDRLPDVAKTLGRAIRTFQSAQRDMSKVIKEDVFDPNAEDPFKDPLAALDKMGGIAKKTGSSLAGDLNEMASIAKKKKPTASAASNGAATTATASAKGESDETPAQNAVSADNAAGASDIAGAAASAGKEAPAETFAERRARYETERAARLAAQAEQKAAEEAAAAAAAVQAADAAVSQVETQQAEAAAPATDAPEASAADAAPTTAPSTIEGRE